VINLVSGDASSSVFWRHPPIPGVMNAVFTWAQCPTDCPTDSPPV
jgi:hypothetical protein